MTLYHLYVHCFWTWPYVPDGYCITLTIILYTCYSLDLVLYDVNLV